MSWNLDNTASSKDGWNGVAVESGSALESEQISLWACSSAGRAPALQAGGQGFESPHVHQHLPDCKRLKKFASAGSLDFSCTLCTNCAQTRHWITSVHNGAVEKASASPPAPFRWLDGSASPGLRASSATSFAN